MHRSTFLVLLPGAARDVPTYDCFYGEDAEAPNLHAPVQKLLVESMRDLRRQVEGEEMGAEVWHALGEDGEPVR